VTTTKHTVELEDSTVYFLEGDVVHTHFREHRLVEPAAVQQMFDAIDQERRGRKVLLMVTMGDGTALSNEARNFASSEVSNRLIAADAIVVRDFGHQLAANVFVRHHRPGRPIQMFPDQDSARAWLLQQHHLIDLA
jgi:hypothetical protein